jgi:CBS domain-containing protein
VKIKDLMTKNPKTCTSETTVATAAELMWHGDCGVLPIVDDAKLVGVVTDRDLCIALGTRDTRASQLRVGAVAATTLATCKSEDDVQSALATMKAARVRRLPVVDDTGKLRGMLSLNDLIIAAGTGKEVRREDVIDTLQAICAHGQARSAVVAV